MSNALTMTGRSLRLSARSPEALLTALLLPVMLMLVFVYLFGGAVSIGTAYVDYVAPGVLLLCAVTGAATTAVTVCQDMAGGIIDRFRSLDVRGTAVLAGHVVASLLRNLASTVLVVAVAIGIGFRPHASAGRLRRRARRAAVLRGRGLLAGRRVRPAGPRARGGQLGHVLPDVLLLRQQRVRAGPHHADVAARVRRAPAGHAGHRDHPRPPARRPGPRRVRAGLVRRHRCRLDRAVRHLVPPPHRRPSLTGS